MHRLDRDTSGLMVVARSRGGPPAVCRRRSPSGEIEREYLALVEGRPPARTGTIEAPIGRDPRVRTRMAVGGAGAREARTHFTLERALAESSLLRLRLETGRTHQIRVHLRAIGHPVCGDPEYGTPGLLGLERQFLHATRLAFEHPITRRARRGASRRCPPTCRARWSAPNGYPERPNPNFDPRGNGSRPCPERRRNACAPGPLHPRGTSTRIQQGSSPWLK